MNLITKAISGSFYSQLSEINTAQEQLININKVKPSVSNDLIIKGHTLLVGIVLEELFRFITRDDDKIISDTKFYDRMIYIFSNHDLKREFCDEAHAIRILTNDIKHKSKEPKIRDYYRAVHSVAQCISIFSDTSIPLEIANIYRSLTNQKLKPGLLQDLDLVNNPTVRLPLALVLDTSASMEAIKIQHLNRGLERFFELSLADNRIPFSVELSIVSFGGQATEILELGNMERQAIKFKQAKFKPHGSACLGAGINLSLELLANRLKVYKDHGVEYYKPWLFLITDNQPADNISNTALKVNNMVTSKDLNMFSIVISDHVDKAYFSKFSDNFYKLNNLDFNSFFEWLSHSTKCVSESIMGQRVILPSISSWAKKR